MKLGVSLPNSTSPRLGCLMRFVIILCLLLLAPTNVLSKSTCPRDVFNPSATQHRYFGGFNMGLQNPDGSCKLTHHWLHEFTQLTQTLSPLSLPVTIFKLFSTSDCNSSLLQAIPAALQTGSKLWVKLWPLSPSHFPTRFETEKNALRAALQAYPNAESWLAGVSVGSEHLYRQELTATELEGMICQVKDLVQVEFGYTDIPVGCADTAGALGKIPENRVVVAAADHVFANIYPFWSRTSISGAIGEFQEVVGQLREMVRQDGDGKVLAVGETGWPSVGVNGEAIGDVGSAEKYWKDIGCWLHREGMPWVWFEGVDEPNKPDMGGIGGAEQNWGVMRAGGVEGKWEMSCD